MNNKEKPFICEVCQVCDGNEKLRDQTVKEVVAGLHNSVSDVLFESSGFHWQVIGEYSHCYSKPEFCSTFNSK